MKNATKREHKGRRDENENRMVKIERRTIRTRKRKKQDARNPTDSNPSLKTQKQPNISRRRNETETKSSVSAFENKFSTIETSLLNIMPLVLAL
jgi:hypothetical protein